MNHEYLVSTQRLCGVTLVVVSLGSASASWPGLPGGERPRRRELAAPSALNGRPGFERRVEVPSDVFR